MDIEAIRTYCLSLPHTAEDIKWEDHLCFTLAEKIYCLTDLQDPYIACLKVDPAEFDMLVLNPAVRQAPHFAKRHWVLISDTTAVGDKEMERLIRRSYDLVKAGLPKKMQQQLG